MNQKFQPRLQCIQSANGENLTEAAHIADRWKRYCEDLYYDEEKKRNWTRILGERVSTTSFRDCSCHPSDSKSQSHSSWWGPSRTIQNRRRNSTGLNAENVCRFGKLERVRQPELSIGRCTLQKYPRLIFYRATLCKCDICYIVWPCVCLSVRPSVTSYRGAICIFNSRGLNCFVFDNEFINYCYFAALHEILNMLSVTSIARVIYVSTLEHVNN